MKKFIFLRMMGFFTFIILAGLTLYAVLPSFCKTVVYRSTIKSQTFFQKEDGTATKLFKSAHLYLSHIESAEEHALDSSAQPGWFLSLIPQAPGGYEPNSQDLSQGVRQACQKIWNGLTESQKQAVRQNRFRFKLDHMISEEQAAYPGWKGFGFDKGLNGFTLKIDELPPFRLMPSWSIEAQVPLKKIETTIRELAQKKAGFTAEQAAKAQLLTFRTESFIEVGEQAQPIMRVNTDAPPITAALLKERIAWASLYLARETDAEGRITYEYFPHTDQVTDGFNLLRHAGTIHAMIQAWRLSHDAFLLDAIQKAKQFFLQHLQEDAFHDGEYFAREGSKAKLGGAGLGLYFLSELEEIQPNSTDAHLLDGLAKHLIRMQQPSGEFLSYYDWNRKGIPKEKSHFYPGEAILGLLQYHILTGQKEALDAATRGMHYLIKQRWQGYGIRLMVSPDAWLAQAIELLNRIGIASEFEEYLFEIADLMIRQRLHAPSAPPDLAGGGLETLELPNVSSAGSKLEAIAAAAWLEQRQHRGQRCLEAAKELAQFVLRSQFTKENSWWIVNPERALGAFRQGPDVALIRNDFVQHNLSGLYLLLKAMEQSEK